MKKNSKDGINFLLDQKKLITISIILFAIFFITLAFIGKINKITGAQTAIYSADYFVSYTKENIFDKINAMLMNGYVNETFFRWSFFIVLTILIFSILSAANFIKNKPLVFIISAIVSFIAVTGIKSTSINVLVENYGVLGLILVMTLPLLIMIFFSAQLLKGKTTIGKVIFQLLLWFYYVVFSLYILIGYINKSLGNFQLQNPKWWAELFTKGGISIIIIFFSIFIGIIILLFNKRFRNWMRSIGKELQ